jgi:hypothetical protein
MISARTIATDDEWSTVAPVDNRKLAQVVGKLFRYAGVNKLSRNFEYHTQYNTFAANWIRLIRVVIFNCVLRYCEYFNAMLWNFPTSHIFMKWPKPRHINAFATRKHDEVDVFIFTTFQLKIYEYGCKGLYTRHGY